MDSYKTFISQTAKYCPNEIAIKTLDAERACQIAQREIIDTIITVMKVTAQEDIIGNLNHIKNQIPDGWKK